MKLASLAMETSTPEQKFRICYAVGKSLRPAPATGFLQLSS